MDNERDALDRALVEETLRTPLDLTDPMDQQWYLECEAINLEKYRIGAESMLRNNESLVLIEQAKANAAKYDAEKAESEARKAEAERELFVLKASQPKSDNTATLEVSCGYCNAEFKYTGHNEEEMRIMHDRFVDEHGYCRS